MRRLCLFALLLLLPGCSKDNPQALLDDYLQRIARTLDLEIVEVDNPAIQALPRRRERRMPTTELRAGLLETLDFSVCDLLPLIAERNSSLGKVMQPSQLLSYELRFFDRLQRCYLQNRQQPLVDVEFTELLAATYITKRSNLTAILWNGLFTSEALERNLSLSTPPIPLTGNPGYGDSLRALRVFSGYVSTLKQFQATQRFTLPDNLAGLENHYAALHHSQYGSQLFSTLRLLTHDLNRAAATLDQALDRRPICFAGKANDKARIMKNILTGMYATQVQPYLARVYREGRPWLEHLDNLAAFTQAPVSPAMAAFRQAMLNPAATEGLWDNFQRAVKAHTQAWQRLLRQCGLMPGDAEPKSNPDPDLNNKKRNDSALNDTALNNKVPSEAKG